MSPFLHLRDISFGYDGSSLFDHLSLELLTEPVLAVMGRSGSGKSTLLRLIANIEPLHGGAIVLETHDPVISLVFQDPVIFEQYSRLENATYRKWRGAHRQRFSDERYRRLVDVLSLEPNVLTATRPFVTMSGGETQRLALLRDLSIAPDLVLLDEPCASIDPTIKKEFLISLRETICDLGLRCIYATHHFDEAELIADEVLFLSRSEGSAARAACLPLRRFVSTPPTVDAALTVLKTPLANVLMGAVGSNGHFTLLADSRGTLVLPPGTVRSADEGLPCSVVTRSALVTVVDLGGQRLTIEDTAANVDEHRVLVRGTAYLYDDGEFAGTTTVDTIQSGESWLVTLVRSS